jgi:NTE family protein
MNLVEIPLFTQLSETAKAELRSTCALREYSAGEIILEPGEIGQFLYAIAAGTVTVRPGSGKRQLSISLGPGEVFGEMSLLSGAPISAAVIAASSSRIYVVTGYTFNKLFADEPFFRKGIADLLARRLRLRTSNKDTTPICALIGLPSSASSPSKALVRGVDHYVRVVEASRLEVGVRGTDALGMEIDSWRASAHGEEVYVAVLPAQGIDALRGHTRPGDAVLLIDDGTSATPPALSGDWGDIDVAAVRIGAAVHRPAHVNEVWSYRLDDAEITAAEKASEWSGRTTPVLDSIARWIARRTIGIALGAGAARGFAHVGVLGVLDGAGVPIDFLSGSSIGGIVALAYAMTGSADGAYEAVRLAIGSNRKIRDVSILPRSALFQGRKVRRAAARFSADSYFPDLKRSALVVAADLITGERIVLDRGLVSSALVATSAIPGLLPPVKSAEHWLVDGAVVSRVPVDLLDRWRCGLKIAVNALPDLEREGADLNAELRRVMSRPFGLARVIARSWDLLGVAHGSAELEAADIIVRPYTNLLSGYDFDAIDSFVAVGKAAAERQLRDIQEAVAKVLRPRPR